MQRTVLPAEQSTVSVTVWTLQQRINRRLADRSVLRKARGGQRGALGEYYIVNLEGAHQFIEQRFVEIEKYGRELGVLQAWEVLKEE